MLINLPSRQSSTGASHPVAEFVWLNVLVGPLVGLIAVTLGTWLMWPIYYPDSHWTGNLDLGAVFAGMGYALAGAYALGSIPALCYAMVMLVLAYQVRSRLIWLTAPIAGSCVTTILAVAVGFSVMPGHLIFDAGIWSMAFGAGTVGAISAICTTALAWRWGCLPWYPTHRQGSTPTSNPFV